MQEIQEQKFLEWYSFLVSLYDVSLQRNYHEDSGDECLQQNRPQKEEEK